MGHFTENQAMRVIEELDRIDAETVSSPVLAEADALALDIQLHLLEHQPGTEMERLLYIVCALHRARFAVARRRPAVN